MRRNLRHKAPAAQCPSRRAARMYNAYFATIVGVLDVVRYVVMTYAADRNK